MEKAEELWVRAVRMRQEERFGEAINAFRQVSSAPDASDEMRQKSQASIELLQDILGFVNADLMNP